MNKITKREIPLFFAILLGLYVVPFMWNWEEKYGALRKSNNILAVKVVTFSFAFIVR